MIYKVSIPAEISNIVSSVDLTISLPRDCDFPMGAVFTGRDWPRSWPSSQESFFGEIVTTFGRFKKFENSEYYSPSLSGDRYDFLFETPLSKSDVKNLVIQAILDFCDEAEKMILRSFNKKWTFIGLMTLRMMITSVPIEVDLNGI